MAVRKKKTLLFTERKKIKIKLMVQLFSRGHHSKMHFTHDLFLQQVFSKAVVKTFLAKVCTLYDLQGRNHGKMLAATSAMVGRICPPWLR